MTDHTPENTQLFLTAAMPCPYLAGKQERKLFTHLTGKRATALHTLLTDNGCYILDVAGLQIADPAQFEAAINNIVGVVTVGLFAQRCADVALLGSKDGVKTLVF